MGFVSLLPHMSDVHSGRMVMHSYRRLSLDRGWLSVIEYCASNYLALGHSVVTGGTDGYYAHIIQTSEQCCIMLLHLLSLPSDSCLTKDFQ